MAGRGREGRTGGESGLTPGSCPPVKHLHFANWANRMSGLSQRRGQAGGCGGGKGEETSDEWEGNVSGQGLQSKMEATATV